MRHLVLAALLAGLGGCSSVAAGLIDTSGKGGVAVAHIDAPKVDRCRAQPDSERRASCGEARERAQVFVRRLAVGDQVCLEGNPLLDGITGRCKVRASVTDASPRSVKLEIREAPPSSKFRQMDDYWYAEEALADHYLRSLGYAAPEPVR